MAERVATCRCGQLRVTCSGDPVRVSVCHCRNCQRRSGSAFAVQARWPDDRVRVTGAFTEWETAGDSDEVATFRFCATCGSTVCYVHQGMPGLTAVAVGAFADPTFPAPHYSVFEERQHPWLTLHGKMEHFA